MIPLIPFLIDTSMVYEDPETLNMVHEWGVVVFEQTGSLLCGGPWPEPLYPDDACAEAPVIWIHGEPFSGTFTVTLPENEALTFVYPQPSLLSEGRAEWNIAAGIPESFEETLPPYEQSIYYGPFSWALDSWRAVPSLPLFIGGAGVTEKFLYYECTVHPDFTDNFFHWEASGNPAFSPGAVTEALYFTPNGIFLVEPGTGEFIPLDMPMGGETDPEFAPEVFCGWADSRLKSTEITALWETWRPELTEEGSYWLVFPIPAEYHEEISTIHLATDTWGTQAYERLFLGAVKLNRYQRGD